MKNKKVIKTIVFFGITFYEIDYYKIIEILKKSKGYLVAPAASALSQIKNNELFHISLKKSRIAIFDSGFFCISLILLKGIYLKKFSGFKLIKLFLQDTNAKKNKILSLYANGSYYYLAYKFFQIKDLNLNLFICYIKLFFHGLYNFIKKTLKYLRK